MLILTCLGLPPDYHEALYSQGVALSNLNRCEDAIISYKKALEFKPDYHEALYSQGVALFNLGRHEDAIISYEKALEFNDSIDYLIAKGQCLSILNLHYEATQVFENVLRREPSHPIANVQIIVAKTLSGERTDVDAFTEYVGVVATPQFLEVVRAYSKQKKGSFNIPQNIDQAKQFMLACGISMESIESKLQYYLADSEQLIIDLEIASLIAQAQKSYEQENYRDALLRLDQAIQIKSDESSIYYARACIYALQSQVELALENLSQAIQLDPNENRELAKTDADFDNIRHDPRFQALIA